MKVDYSEPETLGITNQIMLQQANPFLIYEQDLTVQGLFLWKGKTQDSCMID